MDLYEGREDTPVLHPRQIPNGPARIMRQGEKIKNELMKTHLFKRIPERVLF